MYTFFVTEDLTLAPEPTGSDRGIGYRIASRHSIAGLDADADPFGWQPISLIAPEGDLLTEDSLYFGFSRPFLESLVAAARDRARPSPFRILSQRDHERVLSSPRMPLRLSYLQNASGKPVYITEQLASRPFERTMRLAILNPFAFALGDTVVFLTALRILREHLSHSFDTIDIDLFIHGENRETEKIYRSSGLVADVRHLPAAFSLLCEYDAFLDCSIPYGQKNLCWVDEMLELMAIDHTAVPAQQKRNQLMVSEGARRDVQAWLRSVRRPERSLILVHHKASTADRSLPERSWTETLLPALLDEKGWQVVTALPGVDEPGVLNSSAITTDFERFACLISMVDAFLCVDTCVYHIADAFDVPGIVLFSTLPPGLRIRHYPQVIGIRLDNHAHNDSGGVVLDNDTCGEATRAVGEAVEALRTLLVVGGVPPR